MNFAFLSPHVLFSFMSMNSGICEDLELDVSQSTGSGGRAWRNVSYSVAMSGNNNTDVTTINTFLLDHGEGVLALRIPSTYLHEDTTYLFTVYMCNFMGTCMKKEFPVHVLAVELPPIETIFAVLSQTYRRHQSILYEVPYYDTRTSSCPSRSFTTTSDSFVYQWSMLQSGIEKAEYASQSKIPTVYYLPAYTLPSGTLFELSLVVYDPATNKQVSASVDIYVEPEEVVSVIAGGNTHIIKSLNSHVFDGGESYDKEVSSPTSTSSATLSYLWYCTVQFPVYSSVCPLTFVNNAAVKLETNVGFIAEGTILQLHLQVTSTDGSERSHTSSTQLQVTHIEIPDILISQTYSSSSVHLRAKFPARLKLNGTVVWPDGYSRENMVAEWSYDDEWNEGNDDENDYLKHLLTPSGRDLSASSETSSYVPFVVLTHALPVQRMYTFTLSLYSASSSSMVAKTSITVYRNTPPSPGTLSLSPSTGGVEMDTIYTMVAELWDDEDLPLSYKFTYESASSQIPTVLRAKALSYSLNAQLPAGSSDDTGISSLMFVRVSIQIILLLHTIVTYI